MVQLMLSYFTQDVIHEIRSSAVYVTMESWSKYRSYHNSYDKNYNAVFLFNEFRNTCETIATLPEVCLMPGNLARIFRRHAGV